MAIRIGNKKVTFGDARIFKPYSKQPRGRFVKFTRSHHVVISPELSAQYFPPDKPYAIVAFSAGEQILWLKPVRKGQRDTVKIEREQRLSPYVRLPKILHTIGAPLAVRIESVLYDEDEGALAVLLGVGLRTG